MNRMRKYLIFTTLIGLLVSGCATQATRPITQVIAFGDSFSDNGAAQKITKKDVENGINIYIVPPEGLYWEGRCSNGPVAVDILAQHLNARLTDYAVGGAMSNEYNANKIGSLHETGMLSQVETYQSDLSGKKSDPDALYYIMISGNDWDGLSSDMHIEDESAVADITLENIRTAIKTLSNLGAKRFFVVSFLDGSQQPDTIAKNAVSNARAYQARFDSQLPIQMADLSKQLSVEITVFDLHAVEEKIRSDPKKYGLTNLTDPCLDNIFAATACSNPDERYFWDPYHPTRKVHQIIGEAMAAVYGK